MKLYLRYLAERPEIPFGTPVVDIILNGYLQEGFFDHLPPEELKALWDEYSFRPVQPSAVPNENLGADGRSDSAKS